MHMIQVNLFIFNSSKWYCIMKRIKIVIECLAFFVAFMVCGELLKYILIDDTSSYTRVTFHEMYEQDNIDLLFIGSSHCYRSFIPEILDNNVEGLNTFNAGTSSQSLDGSYMIIQEVAKHNNLKHIYLELYFNVAFDSYKDRTQLTQTYIIADYLHPSWNKINYLLNASSKKHYINSFIVARRNWDKLFDIKYIGELVSKKQTREYKDYGYEYITGDAEWYVGKGFVANAAKIHGWNLFLEGEWNSFDFSNISDDWIQTLDNIINFCEENDISLTLVSAPMSNFYLSGGGNYDVYIDLVNNVIQDTHVDYLDFNLCKEEYFPNKSELFKDIDHLNYEGAQIFSKVFLNYINGIVSEEELFYTSYEEKMEKLTPTVFGIIYKEEQKENAELSRACKIISSGGLEYSIQLKTSEKEHYLVQDFSKNDLFYISPESHGVCTITYRSLDDKETEYSVDIDY